MIKKDCRRFFADSLLLFGFYSENFHFIVIPRTYAVNIWRYRADFHNELSAVRNIRLTVHKIFISVYK